MTAGPRRRHSSTEQARLNRHMRDPKVLQHMLQLSLTAVPATPGQVKRFLATAPPEIPILLAGLTGRTPSTVVHIDRRGEQDSELIVAGLVGALLEMRKEARR